MAKKNIMSHQLESAKTLASNFETDPVTIKTLDNIAFNIDCSSVTDNTGTFYVQHRIYKDDRNFSAWNILTLSATLQLADSDNTLAAYINQIPSGQLRISFVAAGGTPDGQCDIWVSGSSIGG